ncbi:MAG: hypothetical protein HYY18_09835 [Planctomycetes bacterium]|nr:hypothetical protein [Planctomycetota bacterium]
MDFDTWEGETDRLLNSVARTDRDRVQDLLDRAAAAARAQNLRQAAHELGELRRITVGAELFRSWDEGIWCFSSLIRIVRALSAETAVPPEYQPLLDAIPSARMDEPMTPAQKEFWYGSPNAEVGGQILLVGGGNAAPGKGCAVLLVILAAVAAVAAWN